VTDELEPDSDDEELDERHRSDPALPRAKQHLLKTFFAGGTQRVYYQRQLQVLAEKEFFHWITVFALEGLVDEGRIHSEMLGVGHGRVRLYWPRGHRYRERQTRRVSDLVARMSEPAFGTGVGRHGETMFDAAFPRIGMQPVAWNASSYAGQKWERTGHDLDRIFELDGVSYGVEIENQLQYIDKDEFDVKREMCRALGLKPLFVMRALPKSWSNEVIEQGGYALIVGHQLYPHGAEAFAKEVREVLGLPVDAPPAIYEGTLTRFQNWHLKTREVPVNSPPIHKAKTGRP
jgi:hypothetical protein